MNVLEEEFLIGTQSHTVVRGAEEKRIQKAELEDQRRHPPLNLETRFIQNKWAWEEKLMGGLQETVAFWVVRTSRSPQQSI